MLLVLVFVLLGQEVPLPPLQAPEKPESSAWLDPLHGTMTLRYRYRATSNASDSDFYEFLTLSYGDPTRDTVTASLSARFAEDTDGNQRVAGFYPFTSLDDSYRSFATERLYAAYLDFRPKDLGVIVRVGRQTLEEFPEAVLMDGGLLRAPIGSHVQVSFFGGIPDNPFESSPQGDSMYGVSADYIPDPALPGRYRIEYLRIRDANLFGLHEDNLTGFSMDDGLGAFRVHARYTLLEGKSRDLVARLTATAPEAGFLFDLEGTYVFHQIEALSYALDPFASFLMNLEPYVDLVARGSQSFGEVFSVDASFTARRFVRGSTESLYNHEFERTEVTPRLSGWPLPNVSLSVSADFWNSAGDHFWTAGGDLQWTVHKSVVLSFGSTYALYAFDASTGEEHDRVRTYTAQLRWKVDTRSSFDVRATLEVNSIDRFRILEFGFSHAF